MPITKRMHTTKIPKRKIRKRSHKTSKSNTPREHKGTMHCLHIYEDITSNLLVLTVDEHEAAQ